MNIKPNLLSALLLGAWLAASSMTAWAMKPSNITASEMLMVPHYCPDTQTFKEGVDSSDTSQSTQKWVALMGRNFWHIHHYCWALINIHRAERASTPARQKLALLQEARSDLQYLLANVDKDFVLLPEILTWLGRSNIMLNDPEQANEAFTQARELKPDYWPAYYHWATYLHAKGRNAQAMEMVRSGLQYFPGARPMLSLYRDLGGKPADIPPPIVKPDVVPEPSADQPIQGAPAPETTTQK